VRIMEPFWLMTAIVVRAPDLVGVGHKKTRQKDSSNLLKERLNRDRPIEEEVVV